MEDLNLPPTIANIAAGESQTLEFKSSFDKAAIESLVAFANVQGDIVPVGVNDNGAVQGVSLGEETLNEWLGPINSASSPSVLPDLSAHIHLGRFKTPSMIIDDRQIADTPFEAVEQAMRFIVSHISVAFEINGSIHRKERFAYPLPALREALLDAVVHRDYKDGSDIQVKIFDDRISIFSPGGQFAGLQMDAIRRDNYRSRLQHQQPFRRHRELQPRIARRHPLYARNRQRIRYRSSAPDPDQQLVIAAAPNASLLDKLKSNLKEVQARCGELYVFADADSHFPETEQIQVLPLSEHYGDLSPILHVVPVQLLAYPTALAKSVTVE